MQYTRKDGSPWTKIDLRQQATGGGYGSGTGSARASCDQYSVESVFLNGMSVKLFEWLDVGSSGDELQYTETKKWVGDDGLPYRQELVKGKLYPSTETWKEVIIYDYNPNFKIEAPIN